MTDAPSIVVPAPTPRDRNICRDDWRIIDGRRWYAHLCGDAAVPRRLAAVLIHGLGVSSRYFRPTAVRLARTHRVYAPDLPGFGRSWRPRRVLTVRELTDALAAWMSVMTVENALLVADSLGCQIAVDLAVRYPSLAGTLILLGPTGDPAVRSVPHYLWRLLQDIPREPARLIICQIPDYFRAGPRRIARTASHMLRDPTIAQARMVLQPVLVVRGERDPIAPQAWIERLSQLVPHGQHLTIPGVAHVVHYSAPDTLDAAIVTFLGQPEEATGG